MNIGQLRYGVPKIAAHWDNLNGVAAPTTQCPIINICPGKTSSIRGRNRAKKSGIAPLPFIETEKAGVLTPNRWRFLDCLAEKNSTPARTL